ncbi:MAG: radical SAM protein, partial [Candidatus Hydrogenedentota bacterium]
VGCAHGCRYCYARYMQRFYPHKEPWGRFVDVKTNAVEVLRNQVRRLPPGSVFMSSACDGWQSLEESWRLTRECCRILLEHGFRVNALTKSTLILRDLDIFAKGNARIGVTVTTPDERLAALWEPGASSVAERFNILARAHEAGIETSIMFGPLLPFLSDNEASLDTLFEQAARHKVDVIWVDTLNARPKVWESARATLRRHFPKLEERYRRMLFAPVVRKAYIKALREWVRSAAERHGLLDRLAGCP